MEHTKLLGEWLKTQQEVAEQEKAHESGEDCGHDKCETCCAHDERDHGMCLDCGQEEDPGAAIDAAMDYGQDR